MMTVIMHLLITAVIGRVPPDKGNNCVSLDDGGNGLHIDIW